MFPFQMDLIPLFYGCQALGLIDTHLGLLLLHVAICIPFPALVLKNYFSQISTEMDEARWMDAASWCFSHASSSQMHGNPSRRCSWSCGRRSCGASAFR
ncbi:MAG: carbohydrate ABC transporter permease [Rhodobacteraceae bacterium]|nr:carbohydrate ABC transporter permease [Paracoccaceae bacterium]